VKRLEKKLFRITDEIRALDDEERRLAAELAEHERLHHDARLDAIDGNADDRAAFREIEPDLARFQRALDDVRNRRAALEERRSVLLAKLG
jgi:hypothetical protein